MSNEIATCNYTVELIALGYKSLQRFRNEVDHRKSEGYVTTAYPALKYFPRHLLVHCHK